MRTVITDGQIALRPALTMVGFASQSSSAILQSNGLSDIDAVFARSASARLRHTGRSVYETQLTDLEGRSTRCFVKLNWGRRRLWPRMTDLKTGQFLQSLPLREWNGICLFKSIGLNVPERLALFEEGILQMRSAVIIREVPAPRSVDEMLQDGDWNDISETQQRTLLEKIVQTINTIHNSGLGWRGVGSRHFFPQLQDDQSWKVWLIDCEGVHGRVSEKVINRDYRKLVRSMTSSGADEKTVDLLKSIIVGEQNHTVSRAA